jgi:hypothetical protein
MPHAFKITDLVLPNGASVDWSFVSPHNARQASEFVEMRHAHWLEILVAHVVCLITLRLRQFEPSLMALHDSDPSRMALHDSDV